MTCLILWQGINFHKKCLGYNVCRRWDNELVQTVTRLQARHVRNHLILKRDKRVFSCLKYPDWLWGPHILLFRGYCGDFPRYKAAMVLGRPLIPSAAEDKNKWSYTNTPSYAFRTSVPLQCAFEFSYPAI